MIRGMVQLLLFQGLGEIVSQGLRLPVPGPVVGLVALLAYLVVRKRIDEDLETVALTFARHLGLLFVPAAVGVVVFFPQLAAHGLALGVALVVSVALSIAVTALVAQRAARRGGA